MTNIKNTSMTEYKMLVKAAVRGGVTMVQLREKGANLQEIRHKALELQSVLKPLKIPLIINDFVELAVGIDADGVHIGQQDMEVVRAREILGPNKIIGLSIESMEELFKANQTEAISYVTASAVYPSQNKPDCKKIWGISGLKEVIISSRHPVTCIGGIKACNVNDLLMSGVSGIAVISAVHDTDDPYKAALELSQ